MNTLRIQKLTQAYGKTLNFINSFKILPFVWCETHGRMSYRPFKQKWTVLQGALILLHDVFLMSQVIREWHYGQSDLLTRIYVSFHAFLFLMFHANFLVVIRDPTAHPALIRNLFSVANRFYGARWDGEDIKGERTVIRFIWVLRIVIFCILPVFQVMPILWRPGFPTFFTAALWSSSECGILKRVLAGTVQLYITLTHFGMMAYNVATATVFMFLISQMLKGFRIQGRQRDKQRQKKLSSLYSELSHLTSFFNTSYTMWNSGNIFYMTIAVVINTTLAVLLENPRAIITASVSFPALLYYVRMSGNVYELATESLRPSNASNMFRNKYTEKQQLGRRPLRIQFGRFFFADRSLLLTVLSTILTNTINLIVTFRH